MNGLKQLWTSLHESLWFVPGVMVLAAIVTAVGLIELDIAYKHKWLDTFPRIFGAGAEGSRGMLTAIAGSMITVAGLAFSLTIVAMSQVAGQYSSRVLRNFMRDRWNQFVLGSFVGIFAYCLIVLRTVRGGDEQEFVPSLAVFFGLVLAVGSIAVLIFFIHHIASSIQASTIIANAAAETTAAIHKLFPEDMGDEVAAAADAPEIVEDFDARTDVPSPKTGFVQAVDQDQLLEAAEKYRCVIRMEHGVGDFVVRGAPIASATSRLDDAALKKIGETFTIGRYRTIDQDAAFGIRQIVDIALKALSPGINDVTTAAVCVDYLGSILVELADRRIESPVRKDKGGDVRVIARGETFKSLTDEAFDQIRDAAKNKPEIYLRLLDAIETAAGRARSNARLAVLEKHLSLIDEAATQTLESDYNRGRVRLKISAVQRKIAGDKIAAHGKLV